MDNNILQEAARTYNTPCYIFDLDAFISRIRRMEQLLGKQVNIYYAMKANPFLTAAAARAAGGTKVSEAEGTLLWYIWRTGKIGMGTDIWGIQSGYLETGLWDSCYNIKRREYLSDK